MGWDAISNRKKPTDKLSDGNDANSARAIKEGNDGVSYTY